MNKAKTFAFALVSLLVMGAMATGCKSGKNPEERANWITEKVTSKLDLDKDQESKLRDLVKAVQDERQAQREKNKAQKAELKEMILSDKLDKEATRKLMDTRHAAMKESFDPVFEKLQVFHASLKPEQKKEAVKLMEKFGKRFH